MEKIFDKDVIEYLSGFLTSEEILAKQKEVTHEKTLARLKQVAELFEQKKYQEVYKLLAFSPAGDGYGKDNFYIDLSFIGGDKCFEDLNDIISFLSDTNFD